MAENQESISFSNSISLRSSPFNFWEDSPALSDSKTGRRVEELADDLLSSLEVLGGLICAGLKSRRILDW